MGVDWDAYLIYGYQLGFENDMFEYGKEPDWYDPDSEETLEEQLTDALLASKGFTDKWTSEDKTYWKRRRIVEKEIGVEIYNYCSTYERDSVGFILGIKSHHASESDVTEITFDDLSVDPDAVPKLLDAISILGLSPINDKPAWLLCALMS